MDGLYVGVCPTLWLRSADPGRLCGGSNGYRPRMWKYALQHDWVDVTGLGVMVVIIARYLEMEPHWAQAHISYFIFH